MKKILVLVGPTAVGKTSTAIDLAHILDSEIVSADSRQIYRYMDICTAKPTDEQLSKIPHHFVNHINPDENYSAGRFGEEARECIQSVLARDKNAMVVGGSGLYIRAMLDGFIAVPKSDEFRIKLRQEAEQYGIPHLYERLSSIDPGSANKISVNDYMRIERALEIYEVTGAVKSELVSVDPKLSFKPVFVGLQCDRAILYSGIEKRIDAMIEEGVLEETKRILNMGYDEKLSSMQSLGYREMIQHLKGQLSYSDMIRLFKQGTRNYAKRQLTWFRKDKRITWLDSLLPRETLISEILQILKK